MRPHVLLRLRFGGEAFGTQQAGEGFLPAVSPHVQGHVRLRGEAFVADGTGEGHLARVLHANVGLHVRLSGEDFGAEGAAELSLPHVRFQVANEVRPVLEGFGTL